MTKRLELLIPPPLVALASALIMWGVVSVWPNFVLTFPYQVYVAASLFLTGLALDVISIGAFSKAKTTVTPLAPQKASSLVVEGLYRFTRNPMYLGLLFILSGIATWLGSPLNAVILFGFIAYITAFQIKPEEAALEELFGADYHAYKQSVRRWL